MAFLIFGSPWLGPSSFLAWISPQRTTRDMEAPQRGQYIRPFTASLQAILRRSEHPGSAEINWTIVCCRHLTIYMGRDVGPSLDSSCAKDIHAATTRPTMVASR